MPRRRPDSVLVVDLLNDVNHRALMTEWIAPRRADPLGCRRKVDEVRHADGRADEV